MMNDDLPYKRIDKLDDSSVIAGNADRTALAERERYRNIAHNGELARQSSARRSSRRILETDWHAAA
jgi:hypothetical protein